MSLFYGYGPRIHGKENREGAEEALACLRMSGESMVGIDYSPRRA